MLLDSRFLKARGHALALIILSIGLLAAACGGDGPTSVPQRPADTDQPPPATATQRPPVVNTVEVSGQGPLGSHLVDIDGMTLYLFTNDGPNVSNCSGGCAGAWPPLLAEGDPVAGEGLDAERLAAIQRDNGSNQVIYYGHPLYHFAGDRDPGDTLGQDRGGVWFVVSPDGGPIRAAAKVSTPEPYDY